MKYFKEKEEKKILLSEYGKQEKEIKYLIKVLGDVYMEPSMIDEFCYEFHCFGGRYDVSTKPETIQDMYELTLKFPELSKEGIHHIWFIYIRDLFEERELFKKLKQYIDDFGIYDETFTAFIDYVKIEADIFQEQFTKEKDKVDELKEDYSEGFCKHLKSLITRCHYRYDDLIKYLPKSEIIKQDEEHIGEISRKTRIYFGCCLPLSYSLFDRLLFQGSIDDIKEEALEYSCSTGLKEKATFTKKEFLESIKKERTKQLKK